MTEPYLHRTKETVGPPWPACLPTQNQFDSQVAWGEGLRSTSGSGHSRPSVSLCSTKFLIPGSPMRENSARSWHICRRLCYEAETHPQTTHPQPNWDSAYSAAWWQSTVYLTERRANHHIEATAAGLQSRSDDGPPQELFVPDWDYNEANISEV